MIDIIFISIIKVSVKRPRPKLNNKKDMAMLTNTGVDQFSFPSGHSSRAIMLGQLVFVLVDFDRNGNLSYLNFISSTSLYVILNICSYLACFSRMVLLRHHLTDVIVGIFIGYLTYFLVFTFYM